MSATLKSRYSGWSWATYPTRASLAAASPCEDSPKTDTCPSVGSSSPMTISSRVVLPAPFGPTRPATTPAGTSIVQSRSPHTRP